MLAILAAMMIVGGEEFSQFCGEIFQNCVISTYLTFPQSKY